MDKLGRRLREAREARGSTLEEAEATTRIRAQFLRLLEAGDFAAFAGGDVQVRGFLRIYARYLDLCPKDVLARYRAEVDGVEFSPAEATPEEEQPDPSDRADDLTAIRFRPRSIPVASSLPRWMTVRTVVSVGLVLTVLLAILAIVTYLMNRPGGGRSLAPLTRIASLSTTRPPTATPGMGQPTLTHPIAVGDEVTVAVVATEHAQVRVRQGSQVVFEQLMEPGQTETWTAEHMIVVETGNGAALQLTINGATVGPMCDRGELCTRAWGPVGEVAPP